METFGNDIKLGALQNFNNGTSGVGSELRYLRLREAAYEKAWAVASHAMASSNISHQVMQGLQRGYMKFRELDTIADEQYHDTLNSEVRDILHKTLVEARENPGLALSKKQSQH